MDSEGPPGSHGETPVGTGETEFPVMGGWTPSPWGAWPEPWEHKLPSSHTPVFFFPNNECMLVFFFFFLKDMIGKALMTQVPGVWGVSGAGKSFQIGDRRLLGVRGTRAGLTGRKV